MAEESRGYSGSTASTPDIEEAFVSSNDGSDTTKKLLIFFLILQLLKVKKSLKNSVYVEVHIQSFQYDDSIFLGHENTFVPLLKNASDETKSEKYLLHINYCVAFTMLLKLIYFYF